MIEEFITFVVVLNYSIQALRFNLKEHKNYVEKFSNFV